MSRGRTESHLRSPGGAHPRISQGAQRISRRSATMQLNLTLNDKPQTWEIAVNETLLDALRRHGVFSVKHGCETGECGACTVLLDGVPVTSCTMLAAQADGHAVTTVEALGEHPEQGWKHTAGLHPLQQAFIETGAIQCGYCTPAQLLAAEALLTEDPDPTEDEVREALSGVLCRCTGYVKPVEAVLRAAAVARRGAPAAAGQAGVRRSTCWSCRRRRQKANHRLSHRPSAISARPGQAADPGRRRAGDSARRRLGAEGRCRQAGAGQARLHGRHRDARDADRQDAAQPHRPRLHQAH